MTPIVYNGDYCFDSIQTRHILKTYDVVKECDSLIFSYEKKEKSDSVLIANQDSLIATQDSVILKDSLIIDSQTKSIDNQRVIIDNKDIILTHEKKKKWKWGGVAGITGLLLGLLGGLIL